MYIVIQLDNVMFMVYDCIYKGLYLFLFSFVTLWWSFLLMFICFLLFIRAQLQSVRCLIVIALSIFNTNCVHSISWVLLWSSIITLYFVWLFTTCTRCMLTKFDFLLQMSRPHTLTLQIFSSFSQLYLEYSRN